MRRSGYRSMRRRVNKRMRKVKRLNYPKLSRVGTRM